VLCNEPLAVLSQRSVRTVVGSSYFGTGDNGWVI